MCKVKMAFNKETKGTVRFQEIVENGKDPIIGMLYMPKATLQIMGYEPGDGITIDVNLEKGTAGPAAENQDGAKDAVPADKDVKKTAVKKAPAKRGRPKKAAAAKQ